MKEHARGITGHFARVNTIARVARFQSVRVFYPIFQIVPDSPLKKATIPKIPTEKINTQQQPRSFPSGERKNAPERGYKLLLTTLWAGWPVNLDRLSDGTTMKRSKPSNSTMLAPSGETN
ncbi:hypothetical protein ACLOJK_016999 [Asimina triloba]